MKILFAILSLMLFGLQLQLWTGEGSWSDVWRMKEAVAGQLDENQQLEARNRALKAEVKDLKTGDAAIEERARSELGMIGKNETFFQIIEAKETPYKRTAYRCKDKDKCILPGFGQ